MSKKKRKHKKNQRGQNSLEGLSWMEEDGLHMMITPGMPDSPEMSAQLTRTYQEKIRNSPIWDEMVEDFGQEEAEKLLKEFKAELR